MPSRCFHRLDWLRALLGSAFAVVLASCATTTKHGDVTLEDNSTTLSLFQLMDTMRCPKIPLGQVHTQTIRVRGLPEPIFPTWAELVIPSGEDSRYRHDQPWRTARLKIELVSPEGQAFHERTIDLSKDWNGNSHPGPDDNRAISVQVTPWDYHGEGIPNLTNYDIVVHVLSASLRASDNLDLSANWLLKRHAKDEP